MKKTPYETLMEEGEKVIEVANELEVQMAILREKRRKVIDRLNEIHAIATAHNEEGIDIVQAKLSGKYRDAPKTYAMFTERGPEMFMPGTPGLTLPLLR